MSRRKSGPPDSLELLLDTLCNTFGGVLFIAILVVILLQLTGPNQQPKLPEYVTADTIEQLSRTLETVRREIAVLEETSRKQDFIRNDATSESVNTLRQRIRDAEHRRADAVARRDALLIETSQHHARTQRIESELNTLTESLAAARGEREALEQEAQKEREARSHTIQLPTVHSTSKAPVSVIVQFGRLYLWHRYGSHNERLGLNTRDFVVLEKTAQGLVITPRPSGGIALRPGPEFKRAFQQAFARFPAQTSYFQVVVREDSFREFHLLRDVCAELGYEYSLLLARTGEKVVDRGGTARGVQ